MRGRFAHGAAVWVLAGCSLTRPLGYLTDGDDVDGGDGSWCAQNYPDASVCMDFDEGSLTHAFQAGADATIQNQNLNVDDGGDAALTSAGKFASTMAPFGGNETRYARFEEPLTAQGDWQGAKLQFDMRLVASGTAQIDFASLHMHLADGGGAARAFFAMSSSGGGVLDVDQENGGEDLQPFTLPDDKWHTYHLSLELSSSKLAASLQVDDGGTVSATRAPVSDTAKDATFYLGVGVSGPSTSPVEVDFDNVVLLPY